MLKEGRKLDSLRLTGESRDQTLLGKVLSRLGRPRGNFQVIGLEGEGAPRRLGTWTSASCPPGSRSLMTSGNRQDQSCIFGRWSTKSEISIELEIKYLRKINNMKESHQTQQIEPTLEKTELL